MHLAASLALVRYAFWSFRTPFVPWQLRTLATARQALGVRPDSGRGPGRPSQIRGPNKVRRGKHEGDLYVVQVLEVY